MALAAVLCAMNLEHGACVVHGYTLFFAVRQNVWVLIGKGVFGVQQGLYPVVKLFQLRDAPDGVPSSR
jgi:hypothetical protein